MYNTYIWTKLGKLLQATDRRKVPFLDILIECDQKTVVSNAAVSTYISWIKNSHLLYIKMLFHLSLFFTLIKKRRDKKRE